MAESEISEATPPPAAAGPSGVPPPPQAITKLMIAVNKSNIDSRNYALSSKEAFDWTMDKIIRQNFTGFKLILVHVVQEPKWSTRLFFSCFRSEISGSSSLIRNGSPELSGRIQFLKYTKRHVNGKVVFEEHIRTGDPKQQICDAVEDVKPDLLIVGNRDLTAFQKLFWPHVSEYCAKHAECPVVRIKRNFATVLALYNPCDD